MINSLENNTCCPEQQECCQDEQSFIIVDEFKLTGASADEILLSDLGHVRANSRVTLERVSYTSNRINAGMEIGSFHSSTVTTTRSWSSPGEISFASDLDGHAVLGLDLFNQIPGSRDLFGWVNNFDALIKEQNIGLQEKQVGTECSCSADTETQHDIASVENALNDKADEESDENPTAGNRTPRSEFFNVSHNASFSQIGSTK